MIERYVFIKLREDHSSPAGRAEVVAEAERALSELPGVISMTAGLPADDHARAAWDVSLALRFSTLADADAYRHHPDHRRFVDDFLAPRLAVIKAWSMQLR